MGVVLATKKNKQKKTKNVTPRVSIVCSLCFTCDDIMRLKFMRFSVTPIVVFAADCLFAGRLTQTPNTNTTIRNKYETE